MTSELQGPQYHLGNGAFRSREEKKTIHKMVCHATMLSSSRVKAG